MNGIIVELDVVVEDVANDSGDVVSVRSDFLGKPVFELAF